MNEKGCEGFSYGGEICRVKIRRPLFLAPLAGASELCFRRLCHEEGAGQSVTELVSARGLRFSGIEASFRYLEIDPPSEGPVSIQLFGFDPEDFRYACAAILDHPRLRQLSALDINMGCPVKKVVKTGAGSALMKNPGLAAELVKACRALTEPAGIPVSVKFRKGFGAGENTAADFALRMAEAGASLLCLHARTQAQGYGGTADHRVTAEVKRALEGRGYSLPLIANGDIDSVEAARQILRETGADGLMIGRAALRAPWLFREMAAGIYPQTLSEEERGRAALRASEKLRLARRYYFSLAERLGEELASREIRSVFMKLFSSFPRAAQRRKRISELSCRCDYELFFGELEEELVQAEAEHDRLFRAEAGTNRGEEGGL